MVAGPKQVTVQGVQRQREYSAHDRTATAFALPISIADIPPRAFKVFAAWGFLQLMPVIYPTIFGYSAFGRVTRLFPSRVTDGNAAAAPGSG